jgi:hypothetical protein
VPPRVYIETSVLSYLTARPSRDVIVAGHQQVTHQWWREARPHCHLIASDLVLQEASGGDPEFAGLRTKILEQIELVATTEQVCRTFGYRPTILCTPEELLDV